MHTSGQRDPIQLVPLAHRTSDKRGQSTHNSLPRGEEQTGSDDMRYEVTENAQFR